MKIQIVSDLHLEFCPIEITNAGADLLVLAGDILVADYFTRGDASPKKATANEWLTWMEATCAQFPQVIYVLGNHEHYYGNFYTTFDVLQETLAHIKNLTILDQTWIDIGDFRFVGGTLWTNFDHDNFKAMIVRDGLNDYSSIKGKGYRKLTPAETAYYNQQMLHQIDTQYQTGKDIVVVGHHLPSYQSVKEKYLNGFGAHLNPGYASRLDDFILDRPNIKLWVHGHTHDSCDYQIGATRIFCNPRGYQKAAHLPAENRSFNPNIILEV